MGMPAVCRLCAEPCDIDHECKVDSEIAERIRTEAMFGDEEVDYAKAYDIVVDFLRGIGMRKTAETLCANNEREKA